MSKYNIVMNLYFLYALIVYGLVPLFETNSSGPTPFFAIFSQFYELGINMAILYIFRPRIWPDFFDFGLLDEPLNEADGELVLEERRIAPLLHTVIEKKKIFSSFSSSSDAKKAKLDKSFQSNEQVVIMNPVDLHSHSSQDSQQQSSLANPSGGFAGEQQETNLMYTDLEKKIEDENFKIYRNLKYGQINK